MVTLGFTFRGGCSFREASFIKVRDAYLKIIPWANVLVCDSKESTFSVSSARNEIFRQSKDDVVVIADTDILPNNQALFNAIREARSGGVHIPFDLYRALTKEDTKRYYLEGIDPDQLSVEYESRETQAGIIVINRSCYELVGGFDEQFIGWGYEDNAFGCAVRTLIGPIKRHKGTVNHLWHPTSFRPGSSQLVRNENLYKKYRSCEGNKESMLELIRSRN